MSVRIDKGGYDPGGAYWGQGQPLWELVGPDASHLFRSGDRDAATACVAETWPDLAIDPPAELSNEPHGVADIDVTGWSDRPLQLSDAEAQAVRLHLLSLRAWDDADIADMGPTACAAALADLVAAYDEDEDAPHLWNGEGGRLYFLTD